ncbi:MAG TPA: hypothetical protein VIK56_09325 [Rhodoferax sp.]
MSSIQEQIQVRMLAILLGTTDAAASVTRSRDTFLDRSTLLAIGIFPGAETDSVFSNATDEHELLINVEVFARGDPWYSAADVVVTQAHRLLLLDAALQGLITRIRRISRTPVDEDPDKTAGVYQMEYRIRYLSNASDISDGTTF